MTVALRLRRLGRGSLAGAAVLAALLTVATSSAVAKSGDSAAPPDEFSAADQYVESVPTTRGPRAPGVDEPKKAPLPAGVGAGIASQGGAAAAKLEQVATSPDLGAPEGETGASSRAARHARSASAPSVPTAAVSAVGDSEDGSLIWLFAALLLITCLAVGTAAYRHHKHKNATG